MEEIDIIAYVVMRYDCGRERHKIRSSKSAIFYDKRTFRPITIELPYIINTESGLEKKMENEE